MTNIAEFRAKSPTELKETLDGLLREQFKLRLAKTSGELTKTSRVKQLRKDIARILTLLGNKR